MKNVPIESLKSITLGAAAGWHSRTIISVDMVKSTEVLARVLVPLGPQARGLITGCIDNFVDRALNHMDRQFVGGEILDSGDGRVLATPTPLAALSYAVAFQEGVLTENHVIAETGEFWLFRVGIASVEDRAFEAPELTCTRAVQNQRQALAGGVFIDEATYVGLPVELRRQFHKEDTYEVHGHLFSGRQWRYPKRRQ